MSVAVYVIYGCVALPLFLFGVAWRRHDPHRTMTLLVPTGSACLLLSAVVRSLKVTLLGSDYSHRLYTTIEVNIVVAIVTAIYFGATKRWIAGLAAIILAAGWLYMGEVNSVV